jgi:hypothetical protein
VEKKVDEKEKGYYVHLEIRGSPTIFSETEVTQK